MSPVSDYLRVLVTGVDGASGKATTAALKARGFLILGDDMNSVPNDADQFVQTPASLNAAYPDLLRRLIREHRIGWLFPTVAEELVIVVEVAGELRAQGGAVFISAPSAVHICQDKRETAQASHASSIPVPTSAVGKAEDPMVRTLDFPTVSRPRIGVVDAAASYMMAPGSHRRWRDI